MERERVRANYTANLSPEPNNFHLPPKPPLSLSRRIRDAEISIFDAERYFNEGDEDADALKKKKMNITPNGAGITASFVDGSSANSRESSVDGGYGRNYFPTARSFDATPAASSEASWNSQTGLLAKSKPPVSAVGVSVSVRAYNSFIESRKGSSSSTSTSSLRGRRFFGRHCACYGKKSVEVENKFRETSSPIRPQSHHSSNADQGFPKPPEEAMEMTKFRISATEPGPYSLPAADIGRRIVNSGVGGGFSFPVLLSVAMVPPLVEELEEPARASLEVFRPSVELARILGKSTSAPIHVADDMPCDGASSDLFELESFSAPSSTAYRRRRGASLHELPELATATAGAGARQFRRSMEELIAPSECCYAPSEASVEWSVTTAEGGFERTSAADFSSAASEDCGKVRSAQTEKERFDSAATPARNEGGAVKKRGGDGGLMNCGCERAVNVGPDPVRFVPDQPRL